MNRKIGRKPDRKVPVPASGHQPTIRREEAETQKAQKGGTIILTGLKLDAEDGSGRSLELARCMGQFGYGAFFVDHGPSQQSPRLAYCPHCETRHRALRFVDAVDEGWSVLDEENDCILSPETLISGVIQLLRKKAAPTKAATS
jgi:hypothetical protein